MQFATLGTVFLDVNMFMKRFLFISTILFSLTSISAGIKVKAEYVSENLKNQSENVFLINKMTFSLKETTVFSKKRIHYIENGKLPVLVMKVELNFLIQKHEELDG